MPIIFYCKKCFAAVMDPKISVTIGLCVGCGGVISVETPEIAAFDVSHFGGCPTSYSPFGYSSDFAAVLALQQKIQEQEELRQRQLRQQILQQQRMASPSPFSVSAFMPRAPPTHPGYPSAGPAYWMPQSSDQCATGWSFTLG